MKWNPTRDRQTVVLTFIDNYLPGFKAGGPIRAVANQVATLGAEVRFRIVTRDRDLLDREPYPAIPATWTTVGLAEVRYLAPTELSLWNFFRLLRDGVYDVVYLNSFFSRLSLRVLLLRGLRLVPLTPVLLAPRGEFAPTALAVHRRRKQAVLAMLRKLGLLRHVTWQASSTLERQQISAAWGVVPVMARELLAKSAPPPPRPAKRPGTAEVIFVSRILPGKNLRLALRILRQVPQPVSFRIVGPIEDRDYWMACEQDRKSLPTHVTVSYDGPMPHERIAEAFARADLFLFPTEGENFGHVVLESLAAGCPVAISTRTPWRRLAEAGAGWDLDLADETSFAQAVQAIVAMDEQQHAAMRQRALDYAAAINDSEIVEENRRVFAQFRPNPSLRTTESGASALRRAAKTRRL